MNQAFGLGNMWADNHVDHFMGDHLDQSFEPL
jgi:hypothetical protein